MKRILLSQSENTDGSDYIIVDGVLIKNEAESLNYFKVINNDKDFKEIYKDDFVNIKRKDNQILIYSHYIEKDKAGRNIFYLYLINDKDDDFDKIIEDLEEDSKVINRTIDREKVLKSFEKIKNNKSTKKKINGLILAFFGILLIGLLFKKCS